MDLRVDTQPETDLPADVLERAKAVAAAPVSLVTGVDMALIAGEGAPVPAANVADYVERAASGFDGQIRMEKAAERVAALRGELAHRGLDGFVVPMADEYQNEFVPRHAQRLAWLSGFLGSAGTIIVLADRAAVFVDGRYTLQVRDQVDLAVYETRSNLDVPKWLGETMSAGQKLGYDPWLHTETGVKALHDACEGAGAELVAVHGNPVDAIWTNQPPRPLARIVPHDLRYTGEPATDKRARMAEAVKNAGANALALSATDSIAWLLNIRGADVARTPLALCYALLHDDASLDLFVDERKVDAALRTHLGNQVTVAPEAGLAAALAALSGKQVMVDPASAPAWIIEQLEAGGATVVRKTDPVQKAKALKNPAELNGTRAAHRRDGVALAKFFCWLDEHAPQGTVDELSAVARLQAFRQQGDLFRDLSFDTISGAGPNGAIVHYGASEKTNRPLGLGELYLVDSGGQYLDGTTDVTRAIAIGTPTAEHRDRFTRVLRGHIALAMARFPKGTTGHQLDVLARMPLWQGGLNFNHGTGHGVGSYLGVHEGPHSISPRVSSVALEPGMIVSNEPGYYKEGEYGIRMENLVAVVPSEPGEGDSPFYEFETLTLAPIDRSLIDPAMMTGPELDWLNAYHRRVFDEIGPRLDDPTRAWLEAATAPITA
ncbi:aminopeptidase P family protein [Emcibacter sp. SYSU 3D8]|uniref:aminopeptidase P family protein n=1 Tax=Emcibacter sp. SYSU 3D8 TaxID=3133969 RepID=UPI0031FEA8AF